MHIRNVDLNLFIIFDAIYSEGSITKASVLLNLTQPAVSHSLARLRSTFDDPLFVRNGNHMVPTPLAKNMILPVRRSLRNLQATLLESNQFDPTQAQKKFILGMGDILESIVLPKLMEELMIHAPGIEIASVKVPRKKIENELAAGFLDLALDVLLPLSRKIQHQKIIEDRLVVLIRKGHPTIGKEFDLDTYLQQTHILVSSRRSGLGLEDFELSRQGAQRKVGLRSQHYFAAARVVSQTDMLLTMPTIYAGILATDQYRILPFPLETTALEVHLYWHESVDKDPANQWLRGLMLCAQPF